MDSFGGGGRRAVTEGEWLTCTDPQPMLEFIRGRASDRKLRLFAVDCCRRNSSMLVAATIEALRVAERFADGLATHAERKEARAKAFHAERGGFEFRHRRGLAKACVTSALARRAH